MLTRRDALLALAALPLLRPLLASEDSPRILPLAPASKERLAVIDDFRKRTAGFEQQFERRVHKSDASMPYRLFRSGRQGKLPLVVYLHGSGGLGTDNEKQLAGGNVFGTCVWLLPEHQRRFPCHVVAPQTDRGWIRYDDAALAQDVARPLPGLGDGARLALEVVDALRNELAVDDRRIYVTGQSMGGAGVWNVVTHRPHFFAAAVLCCASDQSVDDVTASIETPVWNFHGHADQTVPVEASRRRIAARRQAGGHPLATEYPGVAHNVWQWAYTEPTLLPWLFAQRR